MEQNKFPTLQDNAGMSCQKKHKIQTHLDISFFFFLGGGGGGRFMATVSRLALPLCGHLNVLVL